MTKTAPVRTAREIKIEAMQVGRRYIKTITGCESRWVVESVERHDAKLQVMRDGAWHTPKLVTVTYANGQSITWEIGTVIAIDLIA